MKAKVNIIDEHDLPVTLQADKVDQKKRAA
jgi:hypothetical protein